MEEKNNAAQNNYILEFEHVTKVFPGVRALDDINFGIKKGTVHVLVGENGAGKSTLLRSSTVFTRRTKAGFCSRASL